MLIVRVKRSRNDDPAESLCVVEDVEANPSKKTKKLNKLSDQLSGLSTSQASSAQSTVHGNHLILNRVKTIEYTSNATLDKDTVKLDLHSTSRGKRQLDEVSNTENESHSSHAAQNNSTGQRAAKVMVTRGRKHLNYGDSKNDNYVVIDLTQVQTASIMGAQNGGMNGSAVSAEVAAKSPMKILDPATRLLERGIKLAMEKGDFNDISNALIQGANANHRSSDANGGNTALMAAAFKCNLRVVKRLLLKDIDVSVRNTAGQSALELLKETSRNKADCMEIRFLIQGAITKAYVAQHRRQQIADQYDRQLAGMNTRDTTTVDINAITGNSSGTSGSSNSGADGTSGSGDYVIDIYCVAMDTDDNNDTNKNNNNNSNNNSNNTAAEKSDTDYINQSINDFVTATDNANAQFTRQTTRNNTVNNSNTKNRATTGSNSYSSMLAAAADNNMSIVKVEGLKISDTGDVLLLDTEYDSDWSDLGDDEDPDSNDERYHGNDYPEELDNDNDSEEEGNTLVGGGINRLAPINYSNRGSGNGYSSRSKAEKTAFATQERRKVAFMGNTDHKHKLLNKSDKKRNTSSGNQNSDDDDFHEECSDNEEEEVNEGSEAEEEAEEDSESDEYFNKQQTKLQQQIEAEDQPREDTGHNSDYDIDEYDSEEEESRLPRFDKQTGIGKVLRPFVRNDEMDDKAPLHTVHDTDSIREFWGETAVNPDTEEAEGSVGGRLQHMRARTGMIFGSNPREFDSSGLPKYGAELSDDDENMMETYVEENIGVTEPEEYSSSVQTLLQPKWQPRNSTAKAHLSKDTVAYDSELDNSD